MGFWNRDSEKKRRRNEQPVSMEHLKEEIESFFRIRTQGIWMDEMAGDASDRRFYRIRFQKKGSYASSEHFVLMVLNETPQQDEIPYINIQKFLKNRGIAVPEIYHYDPRKGYLFLEDLGDVTYERRVKIVSKSEREAYYRWAVDTLVQMQFECADPGDDSCVAFRQVFDREKYMYEFEFFITNLLENYLQKQIDQSSRDVLNRDFSLIAETLAAEERCFNHRDYHSRNLMIKSGRLVLVDFQDARMGCYQYDLASLLRDSYVALDGNMVSSMLDYYLRKWNEMGMTGIDRYQFRKIFDWACLQRNIKATGTFGYLVTVKNLKRYEQYIRTTFEYIRPNLEKYREFKELKEVLAHYVEDLA